MFRRALVCNTNSGEDFRRVAVVRAFGQVFVGRFHPRKELQLCYLRTLGFANL